MLALRKYRKDKNIKRKEKVNKWTVTVLYNFLQEGWSFWQPQHILFDIRNKRKYNELHIISAINIDCSQLFDNNKMDTASIKFQHLSPSRPIKDSYLENRKVIIYHNYSDDNDQKIDNNENKSNEPQTKIDTMINILTTIFQNTANISSFQWVNAPFDEFKLKYPFLCVATKDENKDNLPDDYPNEIIDNKLYLGDADHAKSWDIIENLKITHIINVTNTIPNHFMDHKYIKITYLNIKVDDANSVNINEYFDKSNEFIDGVMNNNNQKCLVHCQMGVSRSATLVIAYLMYKHKYTFQVAKQYAEHKRPCVCPNESFQRQLKQYENVILQSNTDLTDTNK